MFSGIVEEMGAVQAIDKNLAGARFSILASTILNDLQVGDSVSVFRCLFDGHNNRRSKFSG